MLKKTLLILLLNPLFLMAEDEKFIENTINSLIELLHPKETEKPNPNDFSITNHTLQLQDGPLEYTAVAGTLPQYSDSGTVIGKLFFTAYLKKPDSAMDEEDSLESLQIASRPLTFIFNGGPGGSSLSMHIGGLGPRRVAFPEEGLTPFPPFQILDNEETLLDMTDLVFIDPMGTGYSETNAPIKYAFYGVESDLYSFAEFIRMFCIRFNRWNCPKYLMGASYGSSRACGLCESLLNSGIHLNGLILLSSALDFHTLIHQRDLPLNCLLSLPTFAATAWYHKKGDNHLSLADTIENARRFAYEQYLPFIMQPSRFNEKQLRNFYQTFSQIIGLPIETIERYGARIDERIYVTELFASQRKIIGGIDSRYIGETSALAGEYIEDPSYNDIRSAFYPSFLNYLQNELELTVDFPKYISFNADAFYSWNWDTFDSPGTFPNFMQRLRRSLVTNSHMKVYLGSGIYDIRTPFGSIDYSIDHLELPASYRKNFQIEYFEAGHGFIFDLPSLRKFRKTLTSFYER